MEWIPINGTNGNRKYIFRVVSRESPIISLSSIDPIPSRQPLGIVSRTNWKGEGHPMGRLKGHPKSQRHISGACHGNTSQRHAIRTRLRETSQGHVARTRPGDKSRGHELNASFRKMMRAAGVEKRKRNMNFSI